MPDALPAVTQPFLLNAVGSFASTSIVVSGRMWSSRAKTSVPLRVFSSTGTTSSSKRPSAQARAASCWLRIAYSSCASRLTPYFAAQFSAVAAIVQPQCVSRSADHSVSSSCP